VEEKIDLTCGKETKIYGFFRRSALRKGGEGREKEGIGSLVLKQVEAGSC